MADGARAFVIEVMLLEERWHGHSEWPPSPLRLFQALVAAAARGTRLEEADRQALQWLEDLDPPIIATPRLLGTGQPVQMYVPNNDLDAVGGDPAQVEKIRAPKRVQPRLLQGPPRFLYVWHFEMNSGGVHVHAQRLKTITTRLHQFGRGIDMAFARAHVLTPEEAEEHLCRHPGSRHEPCSQTTGNRLATPTSGTLESLQERFKAFRTRLQPCQISKKKAELHFRQPPRPVRRMVGYSCPPHRILFDLRRSNEPDTFATIMQREIAPFTSQLRDMAATRLKDAGAQAEHVERFLVGRNATAQDKKRRVRIIPLPSIGHEFAGGAIRRVLVEVPQDCPLHAEDIAWAFRGEMFDPDSGELRGILLVDAEERSMLKHYGVDQQATRWRSITPLALPAHRGGKTGSQRIAREEHAITAVKTALRHAGVKARVLDIRVQREPFDRNSHRADTYAPDRFNPQQLWHVAIVLDQPVNGPLVLGNGRYLGLGLMQPVFTSPRDADGLWRDAFTFELLGPLLSAEQAPALLAAARAALMRLDAKQHGGKSCTLFSGHEGTSSAPARSGHHRHVFLAWQADEQGHVRWLHIIAPWLADRSAGEPEQRNKEAAHFATVVSGLQVLFGPGLPRQVLRDAGGVEGLLAAARVWRSAAPYVSTRRWREGRGTPEEFLREDIHRECARRGLPEPQQIILNDIRSAGEGRLRATAQLHFAAALPGIILLGHGSHAGQGLFVPPRLRNAAWTVC